MQAHWDLATQIDIKISQSQGNGCTFAKQYTQTLFVSLPRRLE